MKGRGKDERWAGEGEKKGLICGTVETSLGFTFISTLYVHANT